MSNMLNVLSQGMEVLNTLDIQGMSQTLEAMNPIQLGMVATKVVELNQANPGVPGLALSVGDVTPFLMTMSSSAESIREFLEKTLYNFLPFIQGGALFLATFKGAAAVFKTILGRFKEAVEDIKWVLIGLSILAVLPTAIEAISGILFETM